MVVPRAPFFEGVKFVKFVKVVKFVVGFMAFDQFSCEPTGERFSTNFTTFTNWVWPALSQSSTIWPSFVA